jgi:mediator of RNA polymerase II transcription subunit 14
MPEPEQPPDPNLPPIPERPKLPEDVVDAPLVRIYNFLRKYSSPWHHNLYWLIYAVEMMSRSYQLEILWYQVCFHFNP